jgi:hypothetical protein
MGRYKYSSPLEATLLWPNPEDPRSPLKLKLVDSSTSIRYLGLYINLDLDWTDHIRHINAGLVQGLRDRHRVQALLQSL